MHVIWSGRLPEDRTTNRLPEYQAPPPLEEMIARVRQLEHDQSCTEAYLYHGTNCYRRWEMNRSGAVLPGRSGYSFFSSNEDDALNFARNACLRDIRAGASNSLTCEPVVLKVRFNARTWIQVDFVYEASKRGAMGAGSLNCEDEGHGTTSPLLAAVLGPIPFSNIVAVLHCSHGRRNEQDGQPVRTFSDGTLMEGIRRLRRKTSHWRLDSWLLKHLQQYCHRLNVLLHGKSATEVTTADELNRLSQVEPRLRLRSHGS